VSQKSDTTGGERTHAAALNTGREIGPSIRRAAYGAEADIGDLTQDGTMERRNAPTVAPRNPAALNGSPAAAKVETLAAADTKNRRENARRGVLLVASAIDTVP
jgi:hypothetical protein